MDARSVANMLDTHVEHVIRSLASEITEQLILSTPVDTSWAQGNWIATIGDVFQGPDGSYGTQGVANSATFSGAQLRGLGTIAQWKTGQGPIYVSNMVPYIRLLDAGSSDKAPSGFVSIAIHTAIMNTHNNPNVSSVKYDIG